MIYANIFVFGLMGLAGSVFGDNTTTRFTGVIFIALCAWNAYSLFAKKS